MIINLLELTLRKTDKKVWYEKLKHKRLYDERDFYRMKKLEKSETLTEVEKAAIREGIVIV